MPPEQEDVLAYDKPSDTCYIIFFYHDTDGSLWCTAKGEGTFRWNGPGQWGWPENQCGFLLTHWAELVKPKEGE